jgi:esterase/lipase superfamily enzyme
MRRALFCLTLSLLAACAPRGEFRQTEAQGCCATPVAVYAVSNRQLDEAGQYTQGRALALDFARYTVSIPETREVGKIQWPDGRPDPSTDFVTTEAQRYRDVTGFAQDIRRDLVTLPLENREVTVFVHGYNTNPAEGVYRLAQMVHDIEIPVVPIQFIWPSYDRATGYLYDRDSVLFSRNALLKFLKDLRAQGVTRIVLASHSLGAKLVSETLRQAELERPGGADRLVDSVVMISPDVSVDVFLDTMHGLSALPQPFIVLPSEKDAALRVSERLNDAPRLGRRPDLARFQDLPITFLDVSAFSAPGQGDFGHLTVGSSPALIAILPQLNEIETSLTGGRASRPGPWVSTIEEVREATQVVLKPAR